MTKSAVHSQGSSAAWIAPGDVATLHGIGFACAALAFCLKALLAAQLGNAAAFVAVFGNATCAWSWLATRSLFRRGRDRERWPLAAVLLLMAITALATSPWLAGLPLRIVRNLSHLGSSTVLLLALVEPLHGLRTVQAPAERRFRLLYAAGYCAILAVAVLAVDGASPGSAAARFSLPVKVTCALVAALGFACALRYRRQHPFAPPSPAPRKPVVADHDLAGRITALMHEQQLHTRAELRVADLASLTGEPEYKVTQCITGPLGFRNFNQMVNRHRLAEARRRLVSADHAHLPILTIALDCGFGSIGPFNRVFKAETGMTPQAYRRNAACPPTPIRTPRAGRLQPGR